MKIKNTIKDFSIITVGTAIVAVAVFFFMLPSHVSVGSGTALAMVYGLPAVEGMDWGLAPEIVKLERTEGGILLTVSNAQTLTGPEEIEGFMVMANQRWAYVPAELRGNQIFVQCDAANAAYINFLQDTSFPEMEFVRNEYGLPLAPMTYTAIPE